LIRAKEMKKALRTEFGRLSLVAGVGLSKRLKYLKIRYRFSALLRYFVILSALQTKISSTITGFNLIIDYTIEPLEFGEANLQLSAAKYLTLDWCRIGAGLGECCTIPN